MARVGMARQYADVGREIAELLIGVATDQDILLTINNKMHIITIHILEIGSLYEGHSR
jgi:hypothetical protein